MINFMTPVLTAPGSGSEASWMAQFWRRRHPKSPDTALPVSKILDLVDRVRGAEAQLARLKTEAKCNGS